MELWDESYVEESKLLGQDQVCLSPHHSFPHYLRRFYLLLTAAEIDSILTRWTPRRYTLVVSAPRASGSEQLLSLS